MLMAPEQLYNRYYLSTPHIHCVITKATTTMMVSFETVEDNNDILLITSLFKIIFYHSQTVTALENNDCSAGWEVDIETTCQL